ncbi:MULTISPECIES: methylmalonyl-CoA epimerase [Acidianus]|uniref:Lactoylglutathione lyase n=1 Tax=Candidatus Acidianus copahuensis TaxID=1160895 RepID=A0A031LSU6_9CREN|nr:MULTISPECIES: methylmalonyl-CoA epimerase [Acidianus]EZQ10835.1 lactoylglutathione lyase [Candidatus Acidianus copahuensis]NON61224.1 methylmalonyl-CoA epimerase [Acidianus sp. RZ1]
MQTENIDHIGIAVENLDEAIKFYTEKFGMRLVHRENLQERGLKIAFMAGNDEKTSLELMEPISHDDQNNTVAKFLKTKGQGMHHLAVKVEDIGKSLEELSSKGIVLIDKEPRKGARGHLVAFIHPKSSMGVLIELVQEKTN